jgi:hypothetical protein
MIRWVLTLVIGTAIGAIVTYYINNHFESNKLQQEEVKKIKDEFSELLGKRITAGLVLARVLGQSEDRAEIRETKSNYNVALSDWSSKRNKYLLSAKTTMPPDHGRDFEHLFERRLVNCMLKPMDAFLTALHRCRMKEKSAILKTCQEEINSKVKIYSPNSCPKLEFTMQNLISKSEECRIGLQDYLGASVISPPPRPGVSGLMKSISDSLEETTTLELMVATRTAAISACTFGTDDPSFMRAVQDGIVADPEMIVLPDDTTEEPDEAAYRKSQDLADHSAEDVSP